MVVGKDDGPTMRIELAPRPNDELRDDSNVTPIVARGKPRPEPGPPPERIDRFVVLGTVGRGGAGVVYSAYDPKLDRKVALKLLRPHGWIGSDAEDARSRFLREGKAMARLQHPNVLTLFDVGMYEDEAYLVLELVEDGLTLGDHLAREAPDWRGVIAHYAAAGRGLAAAHAVGIVHRDFKPANVIVGADGRVRVMDFGLASEGESIGEQVDAPVRIIEDPFSTVPGTVMGTPAYMAPEQHRGESIDAKADQFAFCVALYTALYGQRPFAWKGPEDLREAVLAGRLRPPPADTRVPARVRRIVERGLSVDPADRWPDMQSLLEALSVDPRRRWIRGSLGAAAIAAAMAIGFTYAEGRDAPPECDGGEQRLEGVWDADRKAELAAAFAAASPTFGPGSWERVESRIDDYVSQWSDHHREVCEATEIEGSQTREVMHMRMFCLELHALELEGFTKAIAQPNAMTLRRAVEGAEGLTPVNQCRTSAFEAQLEIEAGDPMLETLTKLRGQLADARGLQAAGNYDGGVELARSVLEEAEQLGHRAFEAEAGLRLGSLLHYAGSYEESARVVERAVWAAEESQQDHVAAEAKTLQVHLVGRHLARMDEAELWSRAAGAAIRRLPEGDPVLTARLEVYRGTLDEDRGDYERALEHLDQALALRKRVLGERHSEVAYVHGELGATYFKLGELAAARRHYQQAHDLQRDILGDGHLELAVNLNHLGLIATEAGELRDAERHFEKAISLYASMTEEVHAEAGEVYGNLGVVLSRRGQHGRAKKAFDQALEILDRANGPGHPTAGVVQVQAARAAFAAGRRDDARQRLAAGLEILVERRGPDHPDVADALMTQGRWQTRDGDLAGARESFGRALRVRQSTFGAASASAAESRLELGRTHAAAGELDAAISALEEVLIIARANPGNRALPDATQIDTELRRLERARTERESADRQRAGKRRRGK